MNSLRTRLEAWHDQIVVLDCESPFVILGTLVRAGDDFIELFDADVHDLRDSETSRELYVVSAARHGIQPNRAALLVRLDQVVAVSRLVDVLGA